MQALGKSIEWLKDLQDSNLGSRVSELPTNGQQLYLERLRDVIFKLFRSENAAVEFTTYYRCFINDTEKQRRAGERKAKVRTLSFWCFNSGVALHELRDLEVRNFILASGTLSPMTSYAAEFRLPFPIRLESHHVIGSDQLFCRVLTNGPSNTVLNSSYANRNTAKYKNELAALVLNLCIMVPEGVLVFFPSYTVLESCVEHWKTQCTGLWSSISRHKVVVVEKRKSEEPQPSKWQTTRRQSSDTEESTMTPVDQYRNAIDQGKGALLLAVCRGKLSEGMDFGDAYGRAVILIGVPYPPAGDPKVILKRQFIDEERSKRTDGESIPFDGRQWYAYQASRAVNQAVGRVIRHKDDFGCMLLCDERFAKKGSQQVHFSKWILPFMQITPKYQQLVQPLQEFLQKNRQKAIWQAVQSGKKVSSFSALDSVGNSTETAITPREDKAAKMCTELPEDLQTYSVGVHALNKRRKEKENTEENNNKTFDLLSIMGSKGKSEQKHPQDKLARSTSKPTRSSFAEELMCNSSNQSKPATTISSSGGTRKNGDSSSLALGGSAPSTEKLPDTNEGSKHVPSGTVPSEVAKEYLESVKGILRGIDIDSSKVLPAEERQSSSLQGNCDAYVLFKYIMGNARKFNLRKQQQNLFSFLQQIANVFTNATTHELRANDKWIRLLYRFLRFLPEKCKDPGYNHLRTIIPEACRNRVSTTHVNSVLENEKKASMSTASDFNRKRRQSEELEGSKTKQRITEKHDLITGRKGSRFSTDGPLKPKDGSATNESNVDKFKDLACRCRQCGHTKGELLLSIRCGHVSCRTCWNSVLRKSFSCPNCEDFVSEKFLKKIHFNSTGDASLNCAICDEFKTSMK